PPCELPARPQRVHGSLGRSCDLGRAPMRQLILGDEWPDRPGGVGEWTRAAAVALRDAGVDVTVFVRSRADLAKVDGVEVVPVGGASFGRWGAWWTRLAASSALAR